MDRKSSNCKMVYLTLPWHVLQNFGVWLNFLRFRKLEGGRGVGDGTGDMEGRPLPDLALDCDRSTSDMFLVVYKVN